MMVKMIYLAIMKPNYLFWTLVLILSLVLTGVCIRSLALEGMPVYASLITRGFFCLILAIIYGKYKGVSLLPKSMKTQFQRALLAGLALTFLTVSYSYLSASAVSVLSNIDVPLLIVLGPLVGVEASRRTRLLALGSIAVLMIYFSFLDKGENFYLGLTALGIGSLLLCFGYLFIKKSMTEENKAVTIITPSVALIFYGLIQGVQGGGEGFSWNAPILFESFLSGTGMFVAYYATMKLYAVTDIATAEFPTLISSIVIQPVETIFLDSPLELNYLLSSGAFVLLTYLIMRTQVKVAHA